jgi:CRP-like cAMP-binding protein
MTEWSYSNCPLGGRFSTTGDGLYLVVEGVLEILSDDVQLALRGPRKYVGELALLDGSPRSATIRAKTNVRLLKLHRDDFHRILSPLKTRKNCEISI